MLIDLLIIILAAGAAYRGLGAGFVQQFFSAFGFFGGLFLGSWLQPHVIKLANGAISRSVLLVVVVLGCALIGLTIGEYIGIRLRQSFFRHKLQKLDGALGSGLSVLTALIGVWLMASLATNLPYNGLRSAIKNSAIINSINSLLPPAPNIISDLGHIIDPNGFPDVFIGGEPQPSKVNLPALGDLANAVTADENSVLRIRGQGCGGIVSGSGFVVGPDLIATNAHVVAGISRPYVQDSNHSYRASVIWFDPNLDFAVLRVNGLTETPLTVNTKTVNSGTPGVVLGYPGGGNFQADPAAVLDEFNAVGHNIYGSGHTSRDVYEVKANIIPGNSGGPLVAADGQVIGIVFAESTTYNQVGYALTSSAINKDLQQALNSNRIVSTASCAEE